MRAQLRKQLMSRSVRCEYFFKRLTSLSLDTGFLKSFHCYELNGIITRSSDLIVVNFICVYNTNCV